MLDLPEALEEYILRCSSEEDPLLAGLNRKTHLDVMHPRMLSGHPQGKILEFISRMIRPEYILEIGTYTGYSAICMARGLQPGGTLYTLERNDELADLSDEYFKRSGLKDQIKAYTGDARDIMPKLDIEFELIFIDGEKDEYLEYYQLAFPKLKPGGFLLADNTLWSGKVIQPGSQRDPSTKGIRDFNEYLHKDKRVEQIILPLRDGLTLARKLHV